MFNINDNVQLRVDAAIISIKLLAVEKNQSWMPNYYRERDASWVAVPVSDFEKPFKRVESLTIEHNQTTNRRFVPQLKVQCYIKWRQIVACNVSNYVLITRLERKYEWMSNLVATRLLFTVMKQTNNKHAKSAKCRKVNFFGDWTLDA